MRRNSIFKPVVLSCFIFFISCFLIRSQEELTYQMPPEEIVRLVDAPRTPSVWVSPDKQTLLIVEFPGLAAIEELAQPELKLAGIRINPKTNGPSPGQAFYYNKMTFKDLKKLREYPVTGLPGNPKISDLSWSPDSEKIAFLITRPRGVELWFARVKTGKAGRLTEAVISDIGYWPSFRVYIAMSPFMHAHQIKDPILLIHGEVDNNSGTFPIRSKRFYHALKGHGAPARMVLPPYESHGYDARESIMHVMWETYNWLEKYVKNKK